VSNTVVIADCDECTVSEGLELALQGRGFIPYPATPPPAPRPESDRRRPHG
jgi:hypothetical protein